jgi:glucuronate isomerase
MSLELRQRLFTEIDSWTIIDPHTHINALQPASTTLADILGYHYYTELAHSAGMPRAHIEEPGISPKEKVSRLVPGLTAIENTIQYSWFIELAQKFFGFTDDKLTVANWEALYDRAAQQMAQSNWSQQVLQQSRLSAVFLTNDFDDPLAGFDTRVYIPCLRTDDLVFHLPKHKTRERLQRATNIEVTSVAKLRQAIGELFAHFTRNGCRACAISLPPDFTPQHVSDNAAAGAMEALLNQGEGLGVQHHRELSQFVFWTLAQYCAEYKLPFDLMIGVNRAVYPAGVYQGMDLYDSRVSLIQYRELFNAFPTVNFPISVLASVTNQELASYSWIFPNVSTNGHWWYSNTPTFIEHDASARLECVPRTKQIGYYSDMYKLEFALPKFAMYKRILSKILAERYIQDRGWSETRAIELARDLLIHNTQRIFFANA